MRTRSRPPTETGKGPAFDYPQRIGNQTIMRPTSDNVEPPWPASRHSLVGIPTPSLRDELASVNSESSSNLLGIRSRLDNGSGYWDFLQVSKHVVVSITDATYFSDHRINVPGNNQFKVRIVLDGSLRRADGTSHLSAGRAYVAAYPGSHGDDYIVPAKQRLKMVVLHCEAQLLTDGLALPAADVPSPLASLFHQRTARPEGVLIRLHSGLLRATNEIVSATEDFPPYLRRPFLEARTHEVICYALKQISAPLVTGPESLRLSARDLARVHEARDILADRFARPPSLAHLAKSVGLSQTKLKTNFRSVFGMTAFEFVRKRRMEIATELLLTGDVTIAEISYQVGFEYPANFTHAFQRFYGFAPSDLKLKNFAGRSSPGE